MPSKKPVVEIKSDSIKATKPKKQVFEEVDEVEQVSPEKIKKSKPVNIPKPKPQTKKDLQKSSELGSELGSESDDEVHVIKKHNQIKQQTPIKKVNQIVKKPTVTKPTVTKPTSKKIEYIPSEDSDDDKKEVRSAKQVKQKTDNKKPDVIKSKPAKENKWRTHTLKIKNENPNLPYKEVLQLAAASYSKEN